MPKILCPHCQTAINVPENYAGRTAHCPKCNGRFSVPAFSQPAAPPEPEPFEPPSPFARPSLTPEFPQDAGPPEPPDQETFEPPSVFEHERSLRKARKPKGDFPESGLGLASMVAGISGAIVFGLTLLLAIIADEPKSGPKGFGYWAVPSRAYRN